MKSHLSAWILLAFFILVNPPVQVGASAIVLNVSGQDTLIPKQNLYSGKAWKNIYQKINGDPYLFSNYFLPGTVSASGKTYNKLLMRYDIFSDEIMIPANLDEIVQLNKEIIDSFSITFEKKKYHFEKIKPDTLTGVKGLNGYCRILFKQSSVLYLKYAKSISSGGAEESDGVFSQNQKLFFVRDKISYPVKSLSDLYNAMGEPSAEVKNYVRINKLKVTRRNPESFVPVIMYYESLIRKH